MTNEQRQQAVDFLRQLSEWLEDGEELEQQYDGRWQPVQPTFFDGVTALVNNVRVKPQPLEGWLVIFKIGHLYCTTPEDAKSAERRSDYVRTVPMREVQ